jgi:4-hydroxy-2-oxoglutarate aldolase
MNNILKDKLSGVFPPVVTPFVNQNINYQKLQYNILKMNKSKIRGYLVLGSNGEFKSLTDEEAIKVVDVIRENKARDKILMVGTGRESAWGTIEFTKKVAERGADFASVLTPHYFASKMTDEVLLRFFIEIAENLHYLFLFITPPNMQRVSLFHPKSFPCFHSIPISSE